MTENIPWKTVSSDLGDAPFYVIQFDKHGNCTSPDAFKHLIENNKARTDAFLFSHGWNNDWNAATSRYDRFVQQFIEVRHQQWSPPSRSFAPVLVGLFWPSTALVAPSERGPDIAAVDLTDPPDVAALADELEPENRVKFLRIAAEPAEHDPDDLAKILAPLLSGADEEVSSDGDRVDPDDLLAVWQAVAKQRPTVSAQPSGGFIPEDPAGGNPAAPLPAAWNPIQKVRDAIRSTTILLMKDRAGRVGGTGVAQMLRELAKGLPDTRISLAGHSYGAKVVLSALCNGPGPGREIDSVLLLQPALSCFAFTDNLRGKPGGYRSALQRVRLPIITTYSQHDEPLTKYFHLAVRRKSDLAEAVIAAEPGKPPSMFSALGGYGPQGVDNEVHRIDMPAVGEPYQLATGHRIVAVDGTPYISSHGAVETPETAWALLSQVRG